MSTPAQLHRKQARRERIVYRTLDALLDHYAKHDADDAAFVEFLCVACKIAAPYARFFVKDGGAE